MDSPIRRQYLSLKARHPDAILLFRLGDFYETFDDDARLVARELDIVLTSRDVGQGMRVPLAGVPAHHLDAHLARLVRRGHRVAICEQMAAAAETKGLLPREVVRVVTPGTVTDASLLEAAENNYLAALCLHAERGGLAWCDVTTGEITTVEVHGADVQARLLAELARLRPAELLLHPANPLAQPPSSEASETAGGAPAGAALLPGVAMTPLQPWQFDLDDCRAALLEQYDVAALDGFGCERLPWAIRAAGAIILYLRDHQKSALLNLQPLVTGNLDRTMQLDDSTIRSLELWERPDGAERGTRTTLLDVLDRSKTGMGARLLRRWLARPLLDIDELVARHEVVGAFVAASRLRQELRATLGKLPDLERLAGRMMQRTATPRELANLRSALALLPALLDLAEGPADDTAAPEMGAIRAEARGAPRCEQARQMLEAALMPEPPPQLGETRTIRPGFRPDLDEIDESAADARVWVAGLEATERERTGIRNLKVGYHRVFGYYLEVSHAQGAAVPEDYQRKQTLAGGERYSTPELKAREATILGAQERFTRLEREVYGELLARLSPYGPDIVRAAAAVARLDLFSTFAEEAVLRHYVRPTLAEDDTLRITAGRHPVVEQNLQPGAFVPNDTALSSSGQQIVILTGPNMAGKSTYLRQVALIVLMTQIGSWVPAEAAHVGMVDRVFTRVGARDDLAQGQSTFMVEMLELAAILNGATPRSLIILDEVGRGTSTYDGLAIARATVEHLHNAPRLGARTLFASHYHELIELAGVLPRVVNYNVAVAEEGDRVIFLHKIVPGGADRSYGIHVARLAGVPRAVTRRAGEILDELERGVRTRRQRRASRVSEMQLPLLDTADCTGEARELLRELATLDPLTLSPLDALNQLFELRRRAQEVP